MNEELITDQRGLVSRILASDAFHKSTRCRQLLEYLSQHHFSGLGGAIHEVRIGAELFERGIDFDPSADSIVRSSVRQLRQRLADYYARDGIDEAWELQIPKGEYRLYFVPRASVAATAGEDENRSAEAGGDASIATWPMEAAQPVSRSIRLAFVLASFALVAFLAGTWWGKQMISGGQPPSDIAKGLEPRNSIMEHFLSQTRGPVDFVPSDSIINLLQSFTGIRVGFEEYQAREMFSPNHPAGRQHPVHWRNMVTRELMNIGDASLTLRAARDYPQFASRIAFRQSRDLQARDLRARNFVFLGSLNANPWVSVFHSALNFRFEPASGDNPARWRNLAPRQGESSTYPPPHEGAEAPPEESYALAAFTSNLSQSGGVLLIGGISQPDTEAAGEFVLSPGSARTIAEALGVPSLTQTPGFEVILRTERTGNTWRVAEVVAQRLHSTKVSFAPVPSVHAHRAVP